MLGGLPPDDSDLSDEAAPPAFAGAHVSQVSKGLGSAFAAGWQAVGCPRCLGCPRCTALIECSAASLVKRRVESLTKGIDGNT